MPDYIYLLENRLSPAQQSALQSIREAARDAGMTVFLTGGAVRDLTSGSPVRDLDVSVQGNALSLKARLKQTGAVLWGEHGPSQTLFLRFPGSVRVEVSSTRREDFPKPGKAVYHPGSILEDLRRRDFTANAMALSLNDGSYGLLMDPLNGVADLEARVLRLVSNYGFLEDPIRLIRAVRFQARLGWDLEEKTKVRFENAKEEDVISHISAYQQGYEVEEIVHEEDGLKVLKALEADGWMNHLCPAFTSAKVNVEGLEASRELLVQLQMQGVNPDPSAAQAQLLTAKLAPKGVAALKKLFVRPGFVREWESQEERAKEAGKRLTGKEAATPSATWKLFTSSDPEAILWLGLTSKSAPIQAKFNEFFTVWPEARQRIPYAIMQEMRITPELEGYKELLKSIFFELIDGRLTTEEEIRKFLEPHSPPAPPPPVTIRRSRMKRFADKNREAKDHEDEEQNEARGRHEEDEHEEEEHADEREELLVRPIRSAPPIVEERPAIVMHDAEPAQALESKTPGVSAAVSPAPASKAASAKQKVDAKSKPSGDVVAATKKSAQVTAKAAAKAPATPAAKPTGKTAPLKTIAKAEAKGPAKDAAKLAVKSKAVAPAKKTKTAVKPVKASKPPVRKAAGPKAASRTAAAKVRKLAVKAKPARTKPAVPKTKLAAKSKPSLKKPAKAKTAAKPNASKTAGKKKR